MINENNRHKYIEMFVERYVDNLSSNEVRNMLIDYIYDEKNNMGNKALESEIREYYPDMFLNRY